jgi:catechol 2,3-dioxygenase-like lactoylglutathione lyase family enzyme
MKTQFGHMQINVPAASLPFYRDLMSFLGWTTIYGDDTMLGVGDANKTSLWFVGTDQSASNDYDSVGMNHLAISTETQADVDVAAAWLTEQGVAHLFDTPRHREEFSAGEGQTYYQVMFETPDHLLIEVVYTGPRQS